MLQGEKGKIKLGENFPVYSSVSQVRHILCGIFLFYNSPNVFWHNSIDYCATYCIMYQYLHVFISAL